jgi:hypothetical protein
MRVELLDILTGELVKHTAGYLEIFFIRPVRGDKAQEAFETGAYAFPSSAFLKVTM